MDLNYLFARHQLSLMSAEATASAEARCSHLGLAAGYANQIRECRQGLSNESGRTDTL